MRKHYIDNLRWTCILLLIPFHAAMAWNCWGEGNYVYFGSNKALSSVITTISPWYMPLLFLLAGVSARFAFQRRTIGEFLIERVKKLLLPFVIGSCTVVACMTYIADCYNCGYTGNFFTHYQVYFTKFTMLTGYDGGFTPAHLWFILYLFIVSLLTAFVIILQRKLKPQFSCKGLNIVHIALLGGVPLVMYPVLKIADKSIGTYLILFILGYYVISEERVMDKIARYKAFFLCVGLVADVIYTYLCIWMEFTNEIVNTMIMFIASWCLMMAILGYARNGFQQDNRLTRYLSSRSFAFYIFHFVWLLVFQYGLSKVLESHILLLYVLPMVGALIMTILTSEIIIRIPVLAFLYGLKPVKKRK